MRPAKWRSINERGQNGMRFGARWRDGTPILVKARVPPDRGLPYVLPARISVHSGSQCEMYAVYMGDGAVQRGLHTAIVLALHQPGLGPIYVHSHTYLPCWFLHAVRKPAAGPMDSWLRPAEHAARSTACPCSEIPALREAPEEAICTNSHRIGLVVSCTGVSMQVVHIRWFLREQGTVAFFSFSEVNQPIRQGVVQFILSAGGGGM